MQTTGEDEGFWRRDFWLWRAGWPGPRWAFVRVLAVSLGVVLLLLLAGCCIVWYLLWDYGRQSH